MPANKGLLSDNRSGVSAANREFYREFYKIPDSGGPETAINGIITGRRNQIPYSMEQGIILTEQGILDCTPGGEQGLGCRIDSLVGVLILELDGAPISERGLEPAFVVDLRR